MTGIVSRGLSLCQLGYALFYCDENGPSLSLSLSIHLSLSSPEALTTASADVSVSVSPGATPENRFASLKAPVERSRARARPISLQTWLLSRCLKVRTATNHFVTVLPRSLPPLFRFCLPFGARVCVCVRVCVCASIGWDFVASLG